MKSLKYIFEQPFILLMLCLTPSLAAVWLVPGFATQDGPAHLYNAQILAGSGDPNSPYASIYAVRWQPLPNWAGHLLYLGLYQVFSPQNAERAAASLTLILLAAGTLWLRLCVAGHEGLLTATVFASLIGLNVTWLFGFTGFLLGASLLPITLAVWWSGCNRLSTGRSLAVSLLLVVGYFCHPVPLGLTAFSLALLAWFHGDRSVRARTLVSMIPLLPLAMLYKSLTIAGGPMQPEWAHLTSLFSPQGWVAQLGWVDPISLAGKVFRPFSATSSVLNALIAPLLWLSLGLICITCVTIHTKPSGRRGFGVIGVILLIAGIVGPDTLGTSHGHYLPQRIVLLGLVALVPWLRFEATGKVALIGRIAVGFALFMQTLFVWDYAVESHRTAGQMFQAESRIGRDRRVAAILLDIRGRFRANPLLHADCLVGVGTGNIVWGDYETAHYYFPVQLREPLQSPSAAELEAIARTENPERRAELTEAFLKRYKNAIDVVVLWGTDPRVEAILARERFITDLDERGMVHVWRRGNVTD
jgi:hypothetical protein